MSFRWVAGTPLDEERIARMQLHFGRPTEPPPVAWFNSEVQEYHIPFVQKYPHELSDEELEAFFRDVTSGTGSFGLIEEWKAWFLYLLPHLLVEIHENRRSLQWFEASISTFMNMHWKGIGERYVGFRDDVMLTLGNFLMDEVWWADHDLSADVAVSSLCASFFLCLKYLLTLRRDELN